jgi:hypothetical protein
MIWSALISTIYRAGIYITAIGFMGMKRKGVSRDACGFRVRESCAWDDRRAKIVSAAGV